MSQTYETSFHVTLPSNTCFTLYPSNKPNDYSTQLSKELLLQGDWEAAILDLQYPHSWPNVLDDTEVGVLVMRPILNEMERKAAKTREGYLPLAKKGEEELEVPGLPKTLATGGGLHSLIYRYLYYLGFQKGKEQADCFMFSWTYFPKGHYESTQHMTQELVQVYKHCLYNAVQMHPQYQIQKRTSSISIEVPKSTSSGPTGNERLEFSFPSEFTGNQRVCLYARTPYLLKGLLGLEPTSIMHANVDGGGDSLYVFEIPISASSNLPHRGERAPRFEHLSSIYVYSSLVKHQMVGNTEAPLLGIVPIGHSKNASTNQGDQEYYAFNPLVYMPIADNRVQRIKIELKTDWGTPFPFTPNPSHKVVCRVHYRRRDRKFI